MVFYYTKYSKSTDIAKKYFNLVKILGFKCFFLYKLKNIYISFILELICYLLKRSKKEKKKENYKKNNNLHFIFSLIF